MRRAARAALRILRNDREGFHEQELVSLVWSFATAGHGAPELFDALAAEAERMIRGFSPQGLANLAWAFATAAHRTRSLFDAVAAEATHQLRSFTPQEVAMIAWAFAAADERNLAFVDKLIQRMAQPGPPFTSEQHRQMNPFVFWCVVELRLPEAQLPSQAMRTRCRENFASYSVSSMRAQQKGGLKDSVGRALRRLGLSLTADYIVDDSLTLSYALLDERIAIEVDGPFQFVRSGAGAGKRPVGAKLLKRRQLQALGWTVLGVPFWEWDEVSKGQGSQEAGDCEAQVEYLRSRLQPVQRRRRSVVSGESAHRRRLRRRVGRHGELVQCRASRACASISAQGRGRRAVGRRCRFRHLTPEDPDARQFGEQRGVESSPLGALVKAITNAAPKVMMRLLRRWGNRWTHDDRQHLEQAGAAAARRPRPRGVGGGERRGARAAAAAVGGGAAECDGRQMANIVHGAAHVGLEAGELFEAVASAAGGGCATSTRRAIANTVWAIRDGRTARRRRSSTRWQRRRRGSCATSSRTLQHGLGVRDSGPRGAALRRGGGGGGGATARLHAQALANTAWRSR